MSIPAVTWILPILNGMPYLPETLESIRAQTFKDFEVLVWDNGSTDGTLEVLREWIPNRLPGRVITGRPLSLGNSLAGLVEESRTHYCIRADADDINLPVRLERQFTHLESHPQLATNSTGCVRFHDEGIALHHQPWFPHAFPDILHGLLVGSRYCHPCAMFRRDAVLAAGNYRDLSTPDAPYWPEDYDLWLRLFTRQRGLLLPDRLVHYRHRQNSLTSQQTANKRQAQGRRNVFLHNAPGFTGIDDLDIVNALYTRQSSCALMPLHRIATHLQKFDGITPDQRWRMKTFLHSAASLTARSDVLTRVFIRLMNMVAKPTPFHAAIHPPSLS